MNELGWRGSCLEGEAIVSGQTMSIKINNIPQCHDTKCHRFKQCINTSLKAAFVRVSTLNVKRRLVLQMQTLGAPQHPHIVHICSTSPQTGTLSTLPAVLPLLPLPRTEHAVVLPAFRPAAGGTGRHRRRQARPARGWAVNRRCRRRSPAWERKPRRPAAAHLIRAGLGRPRNRRGGEGWCGSGCRGWCGMGRERGRVDRAGLAGPETGGTERVVGQRVRRTVWDGPGRGRVDTGQSRTRRRVG